MNNKDRTRTIFLVIIGITTALILIWLFIGNGEEPTPDPNDVIVSADEPVDVASEDDIVLDMWTNDTKATWLIKATEMFNERNVTNEFGQRIFVQIEQMDSGDFGPRLIESERNTGQGPTIISPGTIAWVNAAASVWQDLHPGQSLIAGDCPPLAYAPIGFGMWERMAKAMGWPDTPIGWEEIINLAADPEGWARYGHPEWGQFKFGHTDPSSSNTGLAAMTSFVYATLGQTEGLTQELVRSPEVVAAFEQLELNTFHYGSSTRSLNVATARRGKSYLQATASSENGILATNFFQQEHMSEPLVFIFPKEGAFWSENPFCVLSTDWVTPEQLEAAQIYKEFLLSREAQLITVEGWLRPVDLANLPDTLPWEWQFTDAAITVEDIPPLETNTSGPTTTAVQDVFNQAKKKATIIVVLDRSQSMEGQKLSAAVQATSDFLDQLDKEDEVQVYLFNDLVTPLQELAPAGTVVESLQQLMLGVWAEGNTALFDAVCLAKETAETAKEEDEAAGEKRLYGIVLLSDGEDTNSQRSESEMFATCAPRSESADVVKVFAIAYGEDADEGLLERIANRTNGKAYTADPDTIVEVLQEIVWEQ